MSLKKSNIFWVLHLRNCQKLVKLCHIPEFTGTVRVILGVVFKEHFFLLKMVFAHLGILLGSSSYSNLVFSDFFWLSMLGFLFFETLKRWYGTGAFCFVFWGGFLLFLSPCSLRADLAGDVYQVSPLSFYLGALSVLFNEGIFFFFHCKFAA